MSKYTYEQKLEIVKRVISGERQQEVAAQTGTTKGDIQKWLAAYKAHGEAGLRKKSHSHTGAFKQLVVEDMQKNKLSCREAATKYNLGGHNAVSKWERIYLEEGPEGLYVDRRGLGSKGRAPKLDKQNEEDLIAENQRLRAEVAYLKNLQALVLENERHQRKKRR